jgi:hypothetical protein
MGIERHRLLAFKTGDKVYTGVVPNCVEFTLSVIKRETQGYKIFGIKVFCDNGKDMDSMRR